MEIVLQTRFRDAGSSRGRRLHIWAECLVAGWRGFLSNRRHLDDCELALDAVGDSAHQQGADGDRSGKPNSASPSAYCQVGRPPRRSFSTRLTGDHRVSFRVYFRLRTLPDFSKGSRGGERDRPPRYWNCLDLTGARLNSASLPRGWIVVSVALNGLQPV